MFIRRRLLACLAFATTAAWLLLLGNNSISVVHAAGNEEYDQPSDGAVPKTILVAAATANTGGSVVREVLSQDPSVEVRAGVRNTNDPRAKSLSASTRVTLVELDFDDVSTVEAALEGVDRAFLVSSGFDHLLFERETDFLYAAKQAGIPVVRVSTYTGLITPGTKTSYARAHHGIEAFAKDQNVPVVNLRPNWYFDNLMFNVVEIKSSGQITWPTSGTKARTACIDPRDVASAAAKILLLPGEKFSRFVEEGAIELHGPRMLTLEENVVVLSRAVKYDIRINEVPLDDFVEGLVSHGMPRVHARAFGLTIQAIAGDKEMDAGVRPNENSPLLAEVAKWKPRYTINDWVKSQKVKALFARREIYSDEF